MNEPLTVTRTKGGLILLTINEDMHCLTVRESYELLAALEEELTKKQTEEKSIPQLTGK
jgi:hypothetical protein